MKKYMARTLFSPITPQARFNSLRTLSSASSSKLSSSHSAKLWDPNNRITTAGSVLVLAAGAGFLFDAVYRKVSEEELKKIENELKEKIRHLEEKINAKIDSKIDAQDRKIDRLEDKINAKIDSNVDALNRRIRV